MSSGVKRTAAPQVPSGVAPAKKFGADHVGCSPNGTSSAPLTYCSGEPVDDVNMNAVDDKVVLEVFLPTGKTSSVTVDSNIPMLDLLVHLAARCKVSPSGHVLQLMDEESGKPLDFKPNQTIGSLGASSVYIMPKNKKPDWSSAVKANKVVRTFEITNRFTINLPGGQKAVMRISPQMTLEQVFARVCQDKSLDSRRYTLQHPAGPQVPINLKASIADLKSAEINLIHTAGATVPGEGPRHVMDLHESSAAVLPASSARAEPSSRDPSSWYMPTAGETKKKKGFLSFLSKKDKKFKVDRHSHFETSSTASHQVGSTVQARRPTTPPPERRSSDAGASARPKSMFVAASPEIGLKEQASASARNAEEPKAPPRGGGGKKRQAPPPPQAKNLLSSTSACAEESVKVSVAAPVAAAAPSSSSKQNLAVGDNSSGGAVEAADLSKLHSRNSSDSSGYHELTLSGAESPEAAHVSTTFKTSIDTTSIESSDNLNGDSGIQDMSPGSDGSRQSGNGEEQLAMGGGGSIKHLPQAHITDRSKPSSSKKKKAPPPPPKGGPSIPAPVQEESTCEEVLAATDVPCTQMACSIPEAEEPPPPLTLEMDVTDSGVGDMPTERRPSDAEDDESGEAFNLQDILDSVVFDEEPLRSTIKSSHWTNVTTTTEDEEEECEDPAMAMVETSSIVSEDVEVVEKVRLRPCEFIPPPPPEEPPPENYSPRGSGPQYADKATVVGDDNTSLAPASLKNSPVTKERVYTADSLQFGTDLTGLAADNPADSGNASSETTSLSLPEMETEIATEPSHILHLGMAQPASEDPKQLLFLGCAECGDESLVGNSQTGALQGGFAMTEEIEAPVETVPPPLQFQTDTELSDEEQEEEEVTTVTEEFIIPIGPNGLDFTAAVKVSQQEEKSFRPKQSNSPRMVMTVEPEPEVLPQQDVVEQEPEQPPEKEEFVLTMEDLSSVSLVPLRPKMYAPPKPAAAPISAPPETDSSAETAMSGSPQRSHVHLAYVSDHGHIQPVLSSNRTDYETDLNPARSVNSLTVSGVPQNLMSENDQLSESNTDSTYCSKATVLIGGSTGKAANNSDSGRYIDSHQGTNARGSSSTASTLKNTSVDMANLNLQQQHNSLQEQFAIWQEQLQKNQALLAAGSSNMGPAGEETLKTLQIQMQMQQQMMEQLQASMQAMALQQQQQQNNSQQNTSSSSVHRPTSPQPPPVLASAPTVKKCTSNKVQTRPAVSRFEPELDPREKLMIAIRSCGGLGGLRAVPMKDARWLDKNN